MAEKLADFQKRQFPERLTRLGKALASKLEESRLPLVTSYMLFGEMWAHYETGEKLFLRSHSPNADSFGRVRRNLLDAKVLIPDRDYRSAYRITSNADSAADGICCIVNPFCYVSHISAMQRYGITNRRPKDLHVSEPRHPRLRELKEQVMREDFGEDWRDVDGLIPFKFLSHPRRVRQQPLSVFQTAHPGSHVSLRGGSFARMASIGQTFLDSVVEPTLCGGMAHVIDVWRKNARIYLDDIIFAIDGAPNAVSKVRAGYILDEILGVEDNRIDDWVQFARRGGTRRLDPTKPYIPKFSEKWMISKNV
jgi:predicted transcriptional regulator of viral defense system